MAPERRERGRGRGRRAQAAKAEILQPPVGEKTGLPAGYPALLEDLKRRIRTAQVKAAVSVNRELIALYWQIGKSIVERQAAEGWGRSVVDRLARDLQRAFPGMEGFSPRNIWRMRSFYVAWTAEVLAQPARDFGGSILAQPVRESRGASKLSQPVRVLARKILPQAAAELGRELLQQAVAELDGKFLPQAAAEIPWFHNIMLIEKVKDPQVRLWYARQAVEHGWSRAVLVHQIESNLFKRQGKAITNFRAALPPPQSDLAEQVLKDPYNFEFLTLTADARERELEQGLLVHLRKFLLELGAGFAFVGQQYHLEVGDEDFYIDLLFYHLRLRCFVVIDLKMERFKPEFAGKMNFYLSAVDNLLRHKGDRPSIGLILCKQKNRVVVEYTLRDTRKPIGVSAYRVTERLPGRLKGRLPTQGELEAELGTRRDRQ
ncbi:MAG: DUF1016 domain-containing protein [Planctomycetes bacterium]|nr:DUF1016 domain-containing protein [Planctomycetota bacterium]